MKNKNEKYVLNFRNPWILIPVALVAAIPFVGAGAKGFIENSKATTPLAPTTVVSPDQRGPSGLVVTPTIIPGK